jgi:fermentation-respiration switch protein FrsA (DUF1100 family)
MTTSVQSAVRTTPIISLAPVSLPAPYRGQDLEVRVSAPATGRDLPIVVFAHGFSLSMRDYAPLADYWAGRGFVVIQPTFLDSRLVGLASDDPRTPDIWRIRVQDMKNAADNLDLIERSVPGLEGRLDRTRIAAAGHSYGAQTAGMLIGARVRDPGGEPGASMADPRFTVGVLLANAGDGGSLTPVAAQFFPFMRPDFTQMTAPAFIAAGDHDQSLLSTRGPDWFTDVYTMSPGSKALLTVFGGEHSLGGINGYEAAATTDESPERVDLVRHLSWAYLRATLAGDDTAWANAVAELASSQEPLGRLESK